jgi:hypothetical protein
VGAQPYEVLEQFLKTCGAKKRNHWRGRAIKSLFLK